jgi:hypothetical protein
MSIEVRHLVVKVTVEQDVSTSVPKNQQQYDMDMLKDMLLTKFHHIVADMIRREKER